MSGKLKEFKKPNAAEGESFPSFVKAPENANGYEGMANFAIFY